MDRYLGKTYKLKSSENFEDYMKFINIGFITRKAGLAMSPVVMLTRNDDGSYTFTMTTTLRSAKVTFKLGEKFTEERQDGVKVESLVMMEGDEMVQTQIEDNGRKSVHVRKFTSQTLTVITTADGWDGKCVRVYESEE